jgi:outer membrane autotransporter protein
MGDTGAGRRLVRVAAMALALAIGAMSSAHAQLFPNPQPTPTPGLTIVSSEFSASQTAADLGSNFLERLGNRATDGADRIARTNPGGGGASQATEAPKFRAWGEAYGISARTESQGDFAGDQRKTWGGVAGIGATLAPGVNVGFSVDQSRSTIDVPLAFQSATLDMTQLGANFSIDKGPWTVAGAYVHGFGQIASSRATGGGFFANANYNATIDGVLGEIDYYFMQNQSRIVPKVAFEYVRSATDGFTETGQTFFLVTASGATAERARALIGAEIGHYWIFDRKIFDLSFYGKFVDNFYQNFGAVTVSIPGFQSISVTGVGESQYGADMGAAASLSLSNQFRLYARYDGKFRSSFTSHQGVAGLEVKW